MGLQQLEGIPQEAGFQEWGRGAAHRQGGVVGSRIHNQAVQRPWVPERPLCHSHKAIPHPHLRGNCEPSQTMFVKESCGEWSIPSYSFTA
jgi:hypothetical protein